MNIQGGLTRSREMSPVLVIGIGNDFRGDDAVGLEIARQIRNINLDDVAVCEQGGEVTTLLESWDGCDAVLLIDAIRSGARPGTVICFDARTRSIPHVFVPHVSSHGVGVAEIIELARMLDRLPRRLIIYGVEGASFDPGIGLSSSVRAAIDQTVQRIVREIERFSREATIRAS